MYCKVRKKWEERAERSRTLLFLPKDETRKAGKSDNTHRKKKPLENVLLTSFVIIRFCRHRCGECAAKIISSPLPPTALQAKNSKIRQRKNTPLLFLPSPLSLSLSTCRWLANDIKNERQREREREKGDRKSEVGK